MARAAEKLEQEFAAWLDARGAVATGFGRSALRLALEALEVRGGDVLVPEFVCAQVPDAVRCAGARPVFYLVRRDLTVDPAGFQVTLTPQTRAAIAIHYFGRLLPAVEQLDGICRAHGVPLIEDAALALGATQEGHRPGAFGLIAIFSLTKSDWCYGGGMVTSNSPEVLARLRALREAKLRPYSWLSFRYGLLRRIDFAANRPGLSRLAEHAGRWVERLSGASEGNFYDSGKFDAALAEFAARRARRVLANAATSQRRQILRQLTEALCDAGPILFRAQPEAGDAGSFLLLACPSGEAERWVEQAASEGVTLRRGWPVYQLIEGLRASEDLSWLAEHLLLLEIHPRLTRREVGRIAQTLRRLAGK